MTKEELEKEIDELRKELLERGEEFDRAYQEIAECTIEAEYKERVAKMNRALGAYDSAYNNYMRAARMVCEYHTALKRIKKVATDNDQRRTG